MEVFTQQKAAQLVGNPRGSYPTAPVPKQYGAGAALAGKSSKTRDNEKVLEKGESPNKKGPYGIAPVHTSVLSGGENLKAEKSTSVLRNLTRLLDAGESHNERGSCGLTPLHKSVSKGMLDATRLLLERGADPNIPDLTGRMPLEIAEDNGHDKITELLQSKGARKAKVASTEEYFYSEIESLSDLNEKNEHGETILMRAVTSGLTNIVKILLDHQAHDLICDMKDQQEKTALMKAVEKGFLDIVETLLERGADPEITNAEGYTSKQIAAKKGFLNILKLLSDKKKIQLKVKKALQAEHHVEKSTNINVDDKDVYGDTPLIKYVRKGYTDVVHELLWVGVDCLIPDSDGLLPKQIAEKMGFKTIVSLLEKAEVTEIDKPPGEPNKDFEEEINRVSKNGDTLFISSIKSGNEKMVECLLECGGDLLQQDAEGRLPILIAKQKGFHDIVNLLKGKPNREKMTVSDCVLDAKNKKGKTPLMVAVIANSIPMVFYLLHKGADPTIPNAKNETALQIARQKKLTDCVDLLEIWLQPEEAYAPPPLSKAKSNSQNQFKKNDVVIISGIKQQSELNGKIGVVHKFFRKKHRYEVYIHDIVKTIRVKKEHMTLKRTQAVDK